MRGSAGVTKQVSDMWASQQWRCDGGSGSASGISTVDEMAAAAAAAAANEEFRDPAGGSMAMGARNTVGFRK